MRSTSRSRAVTPRDPGDRTPAGWRLASAAILAGGLLAGDRLAAAPARLLLPPVCAIAAGTVLAVVAGDRRSRRRAASPGSASPCGALGPLPLLDVLVPARDEIAALPGLVADLARQDHRDAGGQRRYRVVVIDDRSTDGTGEAARATAAATGLGDALAVVRREPGSLPDGKGAALAALPSGLLSGDAVVVLDADARLGPDFLRRVAARLAAGDAAFTVRRRVYHGSATWLAAAQSAELDLDGMQLRARTALGGAGEFRGNGMVLRGDRLAMAGGWPCGALTEDLDLSTRLAGLGVRVSWAGDPIAWEAATASARALARQRLRWAEGSLRRLLALLPSTLASSRTPVAAKVDLAVYAAQAVLPPLIAGTVAGGARRGRPGVPLTLAGGYAACAVTLAWLAVRDAPDEPVPAAAPPGQPGGSSPGAAARRRPVCAALGGLFAGQWLIAVPVALARIALRPGRLRFDRTRDRLL